LWMGYIGSGMTSRRPGSGRACTRRPDRVSVRRECPSNR
jgi:hypothetical protein